MRNLRFLEKDNLTRRKSKFNIFISNSKLFFTININNKDFLINIEDNKLIVINIRF